MPISPKRRWLTCLTYYLIRKSDYSVYDAFRKGLRLPIPNPDNIPAGSPGQGGQYTRNMIPPKLWAPLEFDKGLSAAYKFVEDVKQDLEGINAIDVAGLTKLNSRSGENDLIKLFSLLVMHPIEIALSRIKLPESYELNVRCEAPPEEGRAVRVDMLLEVLGPEGPRTLAVLEMKNFGVVKDEMGGIMAAKVSSVQEAQSVAPSSSVRFQDDSVFLVRQCAAYATRFETRHIALCDGSVAIFMDFTQLPEALRKARMNDPESPGGFAGDIVLLHTQTDPSNFHYALLAFFKGAVDEWLQTLEGVGRP